LEKSLSLGDNGIEVSQKNKVTDSLFLLQVYEVSY